MKQRAFPFKKLLMSCFFSVAPIFVLLAILSLFHVTAIHVNGVPKYGLAGFSAALLMLPFISLGTSCVLWVYLNFGYFVYRIVVELFNVKVDDDNMPTHIDIGEDIK